MKCFNHHHVDAVGICKNCNKGLCHECLSVINDGMACKGSCATKTEEINQLIEKNLSSKNNSVGVYLRNAYLYLIMGLMFIIYGVIIEPHLTFIAIMGLLFLVGAVFSFINAAKQKNSK